MTFLIEQIINSFEAVAPPFQFTKQTWQAMIEFVRPARVCPDMHQQNETVQPMRVCFLQSQDRLIYLVGGAVAFSHPGKGVVSCRTRTRRKVHQTKAFRSGPIGYRFIVPFVGRQEVGGRSLLDTELFHAPVITKKVLSKLLPGDQCTVALNPVAIKQVLIRMCAKIMAVFPEVFNE